MHCIICATRCDAKCQKCRMVYYCSQECQKKHWPLHKKTCKPASGELKSLARKKPQMVVTYSTPHPKDEGGKLKALGEEKLDVLNQAIDAPDNSKEQIELFSKFKKMAKDEAKQWRLLDEPAGEAKAYYMLALAVMELNIHSKFAKYASKMRDTLAGMPRDDKDVQYLYQLMNFVETAFYTRNPSLRLHGSKVKRMESMKHDIDGSLEETVNMGEALQYLKENGSGDQYLIVVVLLKPDELSDDLSPKMQETFLKMMKFPNLHQNQARMLLYSNNLKDTLSFTESVQHMGHTPRLYRHDEAADINDVKVATHAFLAAIQQPEHEIDHVTNALRKFRL